MIELDDTERSFHRRSNCCRPEKRRFLLREFASRSKSSVSNLDKKGILGIQCIPQYTLVYLNITAVVASNLKCIY